MKQGEKIKSIIDDLGISTGDFAKSINDDAIKYYKLISGNTNPSFDTMQKVFGKYRQYSLDWFVLDIGAMKRDEVLEEIKETKEEHGNGVPSNGVPSNGLPSNEVLKERIIQYRNEIQELNKRHESETKFLREQIEFMRELIRNTTPSTTPHQN
jgi:hypothetical protein